MSRGQCRTCIYRDMIVVERGKSYCPLAERPTTGDGCDDYEADDPRGDRQPEPQEG